MREILFKALNKRTKKWVEGYYAFWPNGKHYIIQNRRKININSVTLCQYTGLRDSNGVKIFEGDLIKLTPNSDSISVVLWNRDDCCFEIAPLDSDVRFQLSSVLVKEAVFVENKFDTIKTVDRNF